MPVNKEIIKTYIKKVSGSKKDSFEKLIQIFLIGTIRFPIPYLDRYTNAFIYAIDFVHKQLNILNQKLSSISYPVFNACKTDFKTNVFAERGAPDTWQLNPVEEIIYNEVFLNLIQNSELIDVCTHRIPHKTENKIALTNTANVLKSFCRYYLTVQSSEESQIVPYSQESQPQNPFSLSDLIRLIASYLSTNDLNIGLKRVNQLSYSVAFFEDMRRRFKTDHSFHRFFPNAYSTEYRSLPQPNILPSNAVVPFFQRKTLNSFEWLPLKEILVNYFWITAANELENIRSGVYDDFYEDDLAIVHGFPFSMAPGGKPKIWSTKNLRVYSYSTAHIWTKTSQLIPLPKSVWNYMDDMYFCDYGSPNRQTCMISFDRKKIHCDDDRNNASYSYTLNENDYIFDIYSNKDEFAAVLFPSGRAVHWSSRSRKQYIDNVSYIYSTQSAFAGISEDKRTLTCWGDPNSGGNTPTIPPGKKISRIYSTMRAFLLIFDDNSFICWGNPADGGITPSIPAGVRICHVCTTGRAFAATLSNGSIICWGDPLFGGITPTIIPPKAKIKRLCATPTYFAVLLDDEVQHGDAVHIENKIIAWGSLLNSTTFFEKNLALNASIGKINRIWGDPLFTSLRVLTADRREIEVYPF